MLRIPIEAGVAAGAPAWVEVDLGAIAHNVREFRRLSAPNCGLFAVVKADAYGHGMRRVASAALTAGATGLAVANVREGADLRAAGVEAPILIVGAMEPEEATAAVVNDLLPSVGSRELLREFCSRARRPRRVHVEVDTGMRRNGVPAAELRSVVQQLTDARIEVAGLWTHFAAVDGAGVEGARTQLAVFTAAAAAVRDLAEPVLHAANSLAALALPEARLGAVRVGGGLYGFDPLLGRGPVRLRPALSLKARIAALRDAAPGDAVGYGSTFVCQKPSRLATLPLGYADGLSRGIWQDGPVLVRGLRARIVGLISMNQTIVDVTEVPGAAVGDEVVLLGPQGFEGRNDVIAAEERVPVGGSVYEVTSLLRETLPRRYLPARRSDAVPADPAKRGRASLGQHAGDRRLPN
jgi:alanine racemase